VRVSWGGAGPRGAVFRGPLRCACPCDVCATDAEQWVPLLLPRLLLWGLAQVAQVPTVLVSESSYPACCLVWCAWPCKGRDPTRVGRVGGRSGQRPRSLLAREAGAGVGLWIGPGAFGARDPACLAWPWARSRASGAGPSAAGGAGRGALVGAVCGLPRLRV